MNKATDTIVQKSRCEQVLVYSWQNHAKWRQIAIEHWVLPPWGIFSKAIYGLTEAEPFKRVA